MKKAFIALLFLACATISRAQTTSVTACITDSDSTVWKQSTYQITFVPLPGYSGKYNYQGSTFVPQVFVGTMNASGCFTQIVPDNAFISPAGTKWLFVLQPYASSAATQVTTTVTGGSQNFTSQFSAAAIPPRFTATGNTWGYADYEVVTTPNPGGSYYNVTTPCLRIWSGSAFGCGSGSGSSFYQTVQINGTGQTQEPALNFTPPFSATDTPGVSTNVTMPGCVGVGGSHASGLVTDPGATSHNPHYYFDETCNWSAVPSTTSTVPNPLTSSGLSNTSFPWYVNGDVALQGPNPNGVDIRNSAYGARAVVTNSTPAIPGCTATISTNLATLSSACGLVTGDGIDIWGAGPTNTLSTPSAPTVTFSQAQSSTGTGYVVAGPTTGANTYCVKIVAEDNGQGLTAASTAGCSAATAGPLGPQSVSITSMSRSNNVVTVTTASAHGLPVGCSAGSCPMIVQSGMTDQVEFGGSYIVNTVPDNTHYTMLTPLDSRNGVLSTTSTGGTALWFNCIHVQLPSPPPAGVRKYYLYVNTNGGAYSLADASMMNTNGTLASAEPTYMVWDYFGSTMSGNFNAPAWVPLTPPSSATNDTLVTTISANGGTTLITTANSASNSVTNATILIDATPGILAAANAANSTGGYVYIPIPSPAPTTKFVVNSLLDLGSVATTVSVLEAGNLLVNDTIKFNGSWSGPVAPSPPNTTLPQFGLQALNTLTVGTAKPGFYVNNTGSTAFRKLAFNTTSTNLYNYIFSVASSPQIMEDLVFGGGGSSDYMGVEWYGFANNGGGFSGEWNKVSFLTGTPGNSTATPLFISKNNGSEWQFHYMSGANRGFFFSAPYTNVGSCGGNFDLGEEIQGASMPVIVLHPNGVGCFINWPTGVLDTVGQPNFAILSNQSGSITAIYGGGQPSGMPILSGLPATVVATSSTAGSPPAQNFNSVVNTIASFVYDGSLNSKIQTKEFQNHVIGANYSFFTDTGIAAAPTCSVTTAGPPFSFSSFGGGTFTIGYAPIFPNGGWGNTSQLITCPAVDGATQQLTTTVPVAVPGAVSYAWMFGTSPGQLGNNCGGCFSVGLSFVWPAGTFQGWSQPSAAGGGPAGMTGGALWGDNFILAAGPAPTNSSSATMLYQDPTLLWPSFKPNGNTAYQVAGTTGSFTAGHSVCSVNTGTVPYFTDCPGSGLPSAPASPNGVFYTLGETPSGGVAGPTVYQLSGIPGRTTAAASDTILASDRINRVEYTNGGAVAVTLPAAGTTNFGSNYAFKVKVRASGTVPTFTPSAGTIQGASTLAMAQGQDAVIASIDNANYVADVHDPPAIAGTGIVLTRGDYGLTFGVGSLPLSALANQAADTVLLNATGSPAPPTAVTVNDCHSATNALTYNQTTHAIGCNTISVGSVAWSALLAPTAALTLTHPVGDNTAFTYTGNTSTNNLFALNDATGNTGTGAIFNVNSVGTSTIHPIQFTAQGTANGVNMTTAGLLQAIGSGGINATQLLGSTWAIPAAIGSTTPAAGTFTTLLATGTIDGQAPVTITTGASASLGGTFNSGYTFNQEATAGTAVVYTLPAPVAGKQYCIKNSYNGSAADTGTLKLIVANTGTQSLIYNGAKSASGFIISSGAAGDAACAVGISSTQWEIYIQVGTWTLN